jgi:hypothetical protein
VCFELARKQRAARIGGEFAKQVSIYCCHTGLQSGKQKAPFLQNPNGLLKNARAAPFGVKKRLQMLTYTRAN